MEHLNSIFNIENRSGKAYITIKGGFGFWENGSKDFTNKVDALIKQGVTDVEVYLNSEGGSMFEANEIANQTIRFTGSKVCRLGALVASAASYYTTYFDKVIAASNTMWMMHDPFVRQSINSLDAIESQKQLYVNLRNDAIKRYSKKSGLKGKEVSEMMRKTTWLNAEQAKAKGFFDEIDSKEQKLPNNALNALNSMSIGSIPDAILNFIQIENRNMEKVRKALRLPNDATEEQMEAAVNALTATGQKAVKHIAVANGLKPEVIDNLMNSDLANTLELAMTSSAGDSSASNSSASTDAADAADGEAKKDANGKTIVPENNGGSGSNAMAELLKNLKGGVTDPVKKYDDYTATELEAIQDNTPDVFDKLFNAKFQ